MHPSVLAAFVPFSTPLEGALGYMYVDRKNLVTTGMGNLIDPVGTATVLPWYKGTARGWNTYDITNEPASDDEIRAEWNRVKNSGAANQGGGNQWHGATLFLKPDDLVKLVQGRMQSNETELRKFFPAWDTWQANAQLAVMSMAWAMGVGRIESEFKKFSAALKKDPPDYAAAAAECRMSGDSSDASLARRNLSNLNLLLGADKAQKAGAPPDQLTRSISDLVAMASGTLSNMVQWGQSSAAAALIAAQAAAKTTKDAVLAHPKTAMGAGGLLLGGLGLVGGVLFLTRKSR